MSILHIRVYIGRYGQMMLLLNENVDNRARENDMIVAFVLYSK